MPIKVADGAKVIELPELTAIRVVKTLAEGPVKKLIEQAKAKLIAKKAEYAQSDYVIAELRGGPAVGTSGGGAVGLGGVPAEKLYAKVKAKEITLEQFLSCVTVELTPLRDVLGEDEITKMRLKLKNIERTPALFTEFKPGMQFELDDVAAAIAPLVKLGLRSRAA